MIDPEKLHELQAEQHDHPTDVIAQGHVELQSMSGVTQASIERSIAVPPVQSTQELWNAATQDDYTRIALEAAAELRRGDAIHGRGIIYPTNSAQHEAWGVLYEEVDELWDEVKARNFDRAKARKEAIQVAAMAIRFVMNVCDAVPDTSPPRPRPMTDEEIRYERHDAGAA